MKNKSESIKNKLGMAPSMSFYIWLQQRHRTTLGGVIKPVCQRRDTYHMNKTV